MSKIEVNDKQLKENIIFEAERNYCDIDGDIVRYDGELYYVHIMQGIVRKIVNEDHSADSFIG